MRGEKECLIYKEEDVKKKIINAIMSTLELRYHVDTCIFHKMQRSAEASNVTMPSECYQKGHVDTSITPVSPNMYFLRKSSKESNSPNVKIRPLIRRKNAIISISRCFVFMSFSVKFLLDI